MTEQWIQREVTDGIARLLTLSLDRAPANDAIDGTINTWCTAICQDRVWEEQRDAWRFRAAFRRIARDCQRWPSPGQLISMMPAAKPQRMLARPKPNPEVAKRALAEAMEILTGGVPTGPREHRRHAGVPLSEATKELLRDLDRRQAERLQEKIQTQGEDGDESSTRV